MRADLLLPKMDSIVSAEKVINLVLDLTVMKEVISSAVELLFGFLGHNLRSALLVLGIVVEQVVLLSIDDDFDDFTSVVAPCKT